VDCLDGRVMLTCLLSGMVGCGLLGWEGNVNMFVRWNGGCGLLPSGSA
jgi:hypothetical protein